MRNKLLRERYGSEEERFVSACYWMQRKLGYSAEEVLEMPSSRFDVLQDEMIKEQEKKEEEMNKAKKGKGKSPSTLG